MESKEIIVKDNFIKNLITEFNEMLFKEPKCDYEYIYNQAITDVIDSIQTYMDKNPDDIEISLN